MDTKNKNYKISASVICADPLNLGEEIKKLEERGVDQLHFDVMDGEFVPRLGLYPEVLSSIKTVTDLPVDVHLMMENPELFIPAFAEAGADIIVVHAESTKHLHRMIKLIQSHGVKAGVAFNITTPLSVLDYILDDIDLVMLMAINPGIVGHKLIPTAMNKISDLREKLNQHPGIDIGVDGGVTFESAQDMVAQGASVLVCGSSTVFKKGKSVSDNVKDFREVIDKKVN